jgi:hypothetical protein
MTGYWKRWELRKKEALRLERKKLVKQMLKDKTMNKSMKRILQGLLSVTLILGMVSCKKVVTQPTPVSHKLYLMSNGDFEYFIINGVGQSTNKDPKTFALEANVKTGDVICAGSTLQGQWQTVTISEYVDNLSGNPNKSTVTQYTVGASRTVDVFIDTIK